MEKSSAIDKFNDYFSKVRLEYLTAKIANGQIHSFFVTFEDSNELRDKWREISNFIALKFQSKLNNEFEIWNTYLFYKIPITIEHKLKYQIENDTFSSRKIIIEKDLPNQDIINEHILNTDLSFKDKKNIKSDFQKNEILWNVLETIKDNKIVTKNDDDAFQEILKEIEKQSNEN